ncbi:unnamed protein product [Danaus chrysippus]|uniref:(African queen) hypothetical protein n=1 Tax=Danaus chrysippus TaxID=151541 RepID=A0A8J2QFA4_9NEOP|nr:unnamed protein product [Danaus chrysippus]
MKKYFTAEPKNSGKNVGTTQEKKTSGVAENPSTDDSIPGSSHLSELPESHVPSASQSTELEAFQVAADICELEEVTENLFG